MTKNDPPGIGRWYFISHSHQATPICLPLFYSFLWSDNQFEFFCGQQPFFALHPARDAFGQTSALNSWGAAVWLMVMYNCRCADVWTRRKIMQWVGCLVITPPSHCWLGVHPVQSVSLFRSENCGTISDSVWKRKMQPDKVRDMNDFPSFKI